MTHAYQSTLLAKLGGADPDRRRPEHDAIGMYIAEHANDFVQRLKPLDFQRQANVRFIEHDWRLQHTAATARLETLLTTSSGFAIGYIDVTLLAQCKLTGIRVANNDCHLCNSWELDTTWREVRRGGCTYDHSHRADVTTNHRVGIEVKVAFPGIGEVLRQINLYRVHYPAEAWVLATPQQLRTVDVTALERAEIQYVRIGGERFEAWMAEHMDAT